MADEMKTIKKVICHNTDSDLPTHTHPKQITNENIHFYQQLIGEKKPTNFILFLFGQAAAHNSYFWHKTSDFIYNMKHNHKSKPSINGPFEISNSFTQSKHTNGNGNKIKPNVLHKFCAAQKHRPKTRERVRGWYQ